MFNPTPTNTPNPWLKLCILTGFLGMGMVIGQLLVMILLDHPYTFVQTLHPDNLSYKNYLFTVQAILASSIFIVAPLLYGMLIEKKPLAYFLHGKKPYSYTALLTIGLVGSFMFVNTLFIYWNMHMQLPAFLKGFEQWAQAKETELKAFTTFLTTFSSAKYLGIGILVMAVLPAIGEELLFRGILQNIFHKATRNIHLAIIMSAFIFSAIHLQFYGFLPRFLLGTLFGYIYWWTDNLTMAILGHFFNNAFTLIILFLQPSTVIADEIASSQLPSISSLLFFSLLTCIFAKNLYQVTRQKSY